MSSGGKTYEAAGVSLAAAEEVLAALIDIRPTDQPVKVVFPQAVEAALALGERGRAEALLRPIEALPPGRLPPSLRAHANRFRARLAAEDGEIQKAERGFAGAAAAFREFGMSFWLAETLTEHGVVLPAGAAFSHVSTPGGKNTG